MSRYTLQYHLSGTDFIPQEAVDADSIEEAAKIAASRLTQASNDDECLVLPTGEDLVTVPRTSIVYCHVRAVLDRRRASPALRYDETGRDEGTTVN